MSTDDSTEYRPRRAAAPAADEATSDQGGSTTAPAGRARRSWSDEPGETTPEGQQSRDESDTSRGGSAGSVGDSGGTPGTAQHGPASRQLRFTGSAEDEKDAGEQPPANRPEGGKPRGLKSWLTKSRRSEPAAGKPQNQSQTDRSKSVTNAAKPPSRNPDATKAESEKPTVERDRAEQASTDETQADKSPAGKTPADKSQQQTMSANQTRAKQSPAEQSRVEQNPAKQSRAEQNPAKQSPTDKTRADQEQRQTASTDKNQVKQAAADQSQVDKPSANKPSADKTSADKTSANKTRAEQTQQKKAPAADVRPGTAEPQQPRTAQHESAKDAADKPAGTPDGSKSGAASEAAAEEKPRFKPPEAPQPRFTQLETSERGSGMPTTGVTGATSGDEASAKSTAAADRVAPNETAATEKPTTGSPAPETEAPRPSAFSREAAEQQPPRPRSEPQARPDNIFAPKAAPAETERDRGLARLRREPAEEEPVGRRAAPRTRRLDRRNATAITVSAIAVLSIVAVLVAYGLWAVNRPTEQQPAAQVGATPGPVLSEGSLITDGMAKKIDPSRTWTTKTTQNGVTETSPGAACMVTQPSGQPGAQLTQLRQLEATGTDRTAALHRADAFASPEEAIQFFNFRSNEIGGCAGAPLYVERGLDVTGIGNQAVGVRLVLQDQRPEYHTVVLVRTGRVVNVLDVTRTGQAVEGQQVVDALAPAVNRQCSPAVGLCTAPTTSVNNAVPPPAGDQPGFLASGDIPRISPGVGQWRGNAMSRQVNIQGGSGCEAVDLATTSNANQREQRIYLLRNDASTPPKFGLDQVVLQMDSPGSASSLVDTISRNMQGCENRTTAAAKMTKSAEVQTTGVGGTQVKGSWFSVDQKIDQSQVQKHRVAVVAAGNKVVYLRSNPASNFDFSDDSWSNVAKRAGERATQVR